MNDITVLIPPIKAAAEKYNATYAAHRNSPQDYDAVEAWDTATSEFMELVDNEELNIIAGLVEALEARDKQIAFLKEQLAQLANFNPDWDRLEAATDSLREHMAELNSAQARIAELESRTVTSEPRNVLKDHQIRELVTELRDIAVDYHDSSSLRERIDRAVCATEKRIAELESRTVTVKLPDSFYPDGDIELPLVMNEYQVIEALVAAGCKPVAVCPRCKRELDLSVKHDGAHYCHSAAGIQVIEGEQKNG